MKALGFLSLGFLFILAACATEDRLVLTPTSFESLSDFADEDHVAALNTYLVSCEAILNRGEGEVGKGILAAPVSAWKTSCESAAKVLPYPASAKAFFETEFVPYLASNNGKQEGLFTGYYIPEMRGSLAKVGEFTTPVYAVPDDLTNEPYYTRAQINSGALTEGHPIAWVDDPVALFFIEIQGSGMLRLPNDSVYTIGYAGKNNRAFIPIGRVMVEKGLLSADNVSLYSIKKWLYENPGKAKEIMEENPSYVFFKHLPDGVIRGGQGVGLTPERSLAVDVRFIPYGMPIYLDTDLPENAVDSPRNFHQLMIAQDTGGAIRGPVRGDIYFGPGKSAERKAGNMKQRGRYTLLIPKAVYEEIKGKIDE